MAVIRPRLPDLAFTMVPNAWVRDPDLPPGPKAYICYLLSHAEGYKCSTAQAAREMGVNRGTVSEWNRKLAELGYFVAVSQARTSGRWAENDYTLTPCTDRRPPRPAPDNPTLPTLDTVGKPAVSVNPSRSTVSGLPDTVNPADRRQPGEDQGLLTETPASHLRAVDSPPTLAQRATALAREHYDATGGLAKFQAVAAIAKRALAVEDDGHPRYTDADVRKALAFLREAGRPVTLETIRAALEGTATVVPGRYRRAGSPYRDPVGDPDAFRGGF